MRRVAALAAICAAIVAAIVSTAGAAPAPDGRQLYTQSCSSCHGMNLQGIPNRAPKLRGVGAAAADFYLSTGRMPLDKPGDEPLRHKPAFNRAQIDALVKYVGSFGGPGIPSVDPGQGDLRAGMHAFTAHCAGCHQVVGEGGLVTKARVPRVKGIAPVQIAEAVRIGPYLMPPFSEQVVDKHEVDSIARYLQYTKHPDDRGGWSIGHIGPIPEGMVAWFIGALALALVARLLGERMPDKGKPE